MHAYFARKKPLIARELRRMLESRSAELGRINGWGPDMVARFLAFCLKGKMIRGGLLVLAWDMHARRRGVRRCAPLGPARRAPGGRGHGGAALLPPDP